MRTFPRVSIGGGGADASLNVKETTLFVLEILTSVSCGVKINLGCMPKNKKNIDDKLRDCT